MAIGPGLPGQELQAFAEGFACGQVGILSVRIDDGDANTIFGPSTANIIELSCDGDGFAVYRFDGMFPSDATLSPYLITWTGASATDPLIETTASEEILVEPLAFPSADEPCSPWILPEDVAACHDDLILSSDNIDLLERSIAAAQFLLFESSGRRYPGVCGPISVRPCRTSDCWPGLQVLSRGFVIGGWNWYSGFWDGYNCGCRPLSRVKLAGLVQGIAQVKVDGVLVPQSEYRVDEGRWLVRKDDGFWPRCQDLSKDDDQVGTFSVAYWYGKPVPQAGKDACVQLAYEAFKSCTGQECNLPIGITRVNRAGLTIERTFLQRNRDGVWQSGLGLVDIFLNSVNPHGIRRRAVFWSASSKNRYARPAG